MLVKHHLVVNTIELPLPCLPTLPKFIQWLIDRNRFVRPDPILPFQEVQYSRQGASKDKVPENTMAVFRFVQEAFVIPLDIEKDHKVCMYIVDTGARFDRASWLAGARSRPSLVSPRQLTPHEGGPSVYVVEVRLVHFLFSRRWATLQHFLFAQGRLVASAAVVRHSLEYDTVAAPLFV